MKQGIIKILWKWTKWAYKHPKFMRRLSFCGLILDSIVLLGFIAAHQFNEFFWLFFWIWVWAFIDWGHTMISFQEPRDIGEADDYEDLR
jgi:hypothetical protein